MTFVLRLLKSYPRKCVQSKSLDRIVSKTRLHLAAGKSLEGSHLVCCVFSKHCLLIGTDRLLCTNFFLGLFHGEYEFQDPKSEDEV